MKIAITGATGFVGRHLTHALLADGHEVVLIARGRDRRNMAVRHLPHSRFVPIGIDDVAQLADAFAGCDAVAHCAGINRELGQQTYQHVHVEGTRKVVTAAQQAGVTKIVLLSFLRARPACGLLYHESKWAAEETVRSSGLDYTVLKASMIYGPGDAMLDHLSRWLYTLPLFPLVGLRDRPIRPTAVEDVVRLMQAALVEGRLARQTVAVMGPEALTLGEVVRRIARVLGKRVYLFRLPVWLHYVFAWLFEQVMVVPLLTRAQVRMLAEGMVAPLPAVDPLPPDLVPATALTDQQIRQGLPEAGSFGLKDLRLFARFART